MHPQILLHLARARDAEIAQAAERSRRLRESRRTRIRRPHGRGNAGDL
jgi:hypothetical protein